MNTSSKLFPPDLKNPHLSKEERKLAVSFHGYKNLLDYLTKTHDFGLALKILEALLDPLEHGYIMQVYSGEYETHSEDDQTAVSKSSLYEAVTQAVTQANSLPPEIALQLGSNIDALKKLHQNLKKKNT
jgi:hypothetical protein